MWRPWQTDDENEQQAQVPVIQAVQVQAPIVQHIPAAAHSSNRSEKRALSKDAQQIVNNVYCYYKNAVDDVFMCIGLSSPTWAVIKQRVIMYNFWQ